MMSNYREDMLQAIEASTDPDGIFNVTRPINRDRHTGLILGMDDFIANRVARF